jgi:site-specific DNA-methyltransferase (adenine-specific)
MGQRMTAQIIYGDCIDELMNLQKAPRLIFADPPYNIGIDYGDGKKADRRDDDDYLAWCRDWVEACHTALTADGSLWVMICDEWADHFGIILRRIGFHRRNWIKWYETFGVNCQNNFNRCSRHIFYCVKDTKHFVFNGDAVNRPSDRQTKYNDKRAIPTGKIWDNVWQIPRLVGNAKERVEGFPTQLPLALLRPIVGCASDPGDLVVDPFSGSATTGVAAIELGRNYIGIETQETFVELSRLRVQATTEFMEVVCGAHNSARGDRSLEAKGQP